MRYQLVSPPAVLVLAMIAGSGWVSTARSAPVFTGAALSETAISPNADDVQDFTILNYDVLTDSADVRILLVPPGGGSVIDTVQSFSRRGTGTHSVVFDGSISTGTVADGSYEFQILGVGTQGQGTENLTLPLLVDRNAPGIDVLSLLEPVEPIVQNGAFIRLETCVSGEPDSVYADFSALDSGYDSTQVGVAVNGTCTEFTYTVSAGNTLADASGLRAVIFARDVAGNLSSRGIPLCLSNFPPSITDVVLVNQTPLFQNGDQLQLEVEFNSPNIMNAGADFSALDSGFSTLGVSVEPLGNQRFRLRYEISAGNTNPDGDYPLTLIGTDQGCGRVEDSTIMVSLDNQGLFTSLIKDVTPNTPAFSPNGDGIKDQVTVTFEVVEDTVTVLVVAENVQLRDPDNVESILVASADFPRGIHNVIWDGSGSNFGPERLVDQEISILLRAVSSELDRQRSVVVANEVDNTPPIPQQIPDPATGLRNGQVTAFRVTYDREGYTLLPDFSNLDSEFIQGMTAFSLADSGGGVYEIGYAVSAGNVNRDTVDIVIPIVATDLAGNNVTSDFLRACLDNQPPQFISAVITGEPGPYANGDDIELQVTWQSEPHQDTLSVSADFSAVDDRFDPVSRPATVFNRGNGVFDVLYMISSTNNIEEVTQVPIRITASDIPGIGCGSTTVDALLVDLDNIGPSERPVLNATAPVVRTTTVLLTGTAPEASSVEIQRFTVAVDTLTVNPIDGAFSGTVSLVQGENEFRAFGIDEAGNRSTPSLPIQVFSAPSSVMLVPGRFAPGDEFFLALFSPARRVVIHIYNLEGMEIHRIEDGGSDLFNIAWNGLTRSGVLATSGPCIAVAEIEGEDGSRERLRRAFVFTRRGVEP